MFTHGKLFLSSVRFSDSKLFSLSSWSLGGPRANIRFMKLDLKPHLKRMKLTQAELAERVDISPGYLSLLVSGKKKPSLKVLENIASTLQLSPGELYDEPPLRPPGFREAEAEPFRHSGQNIGISLARILAPNAKKAETYTVKRAAVNFGMAPGDLLITDIGAEPADGDIVLVNRYDPETDASTTLIRCWASPWLVGDPQDPEPLMKLSDDDQNIALLGVVRGVARGPGINTKE